MEFYKAIPEQNRNQFIETFFGAEYTVESLEKLNDTEFFSGIFNAIMKQIGASGDLNFDGLEILGGVNEGKDITHLVTRNRVSVGEIEMETMEVLSLKKHGDDWKIMLSGKISGLPAQLKAAFGQQ
jgi:hypothetical protein